MKFSFFFKETVPLCLGAGEIDLFHLHDDRELPARECDVASFARTLVVGVAKGHQRFKFQSCLFQILVR